MSNIDTGGPAFPTPAVIDHDTGEVAIDVVPGMTLRDWFAGQAMQWVIDAYVNNTEELFDFGNRSDMTPSQYVATVAYELADDMIAEKRRSEGIQ